MMDIETLEALEAWKLAGDLTKEICKVAKAYLKDLKED
jgi:hypothetical protein